MRTNTKNDARQYRWLSTAALLVPLALGGCYSGINTGSEDDTAGGEILTAPTRASTRTESPARLPSTAPRSVSTPRSYFEEEVARPILQAAVLRLSQRQRGSQGHRLHPSG